MEIGDQPKFTKKNFNFDKYGPAIRFALGAVGGGGIGYYISQDGLELAWVLLGFPGGYLGLLFHAVH